MMFVVARLSPVRLAPKLLEQIDLPLQTPPEERLLRLIAKVPGLQKLGQVIARNQHLRPALRRALARLENGIRDVKPEDTMRLLERIAIKGIRFPGSLVMLSKVMFTLEGLLADVGGGSDTTMGFTIARHVAQDWLTNRAAYRSPLMTRDLFALQCSALLYTSRLWLRFEKTLLNRWLPRRPDPLLSGGNAP